MPDYIGEWTSDHTWLLSLLRGELVAFADFASVGSAADAPVGLGFIQDLVTSTTWGAPTDSRNGVARATVAASGTLKISTGPGGGATGVTSAQRNPSLRVICIPAAAGANLSVQRWGFIAPAAADTLAGAYVRSTTTGHLFFVSRSEAGVETTVDLGVAPAVQTDYRIYTKDGGATWCLDTNGAFTAAITTNLVGTTTRLLPDLTVTSTAGGANTIDLDLMFFRAWRGTPPVMRPDRFIAEDLEGRLMRRCLLGLGECSLVAGVAAGSVLPFEMASIAGTGSAGLTGAQQGYMGLVRAAGVNAALGSARSGTFCTVCSPNHSPRLWGIGRFDNLGTTDILVWGFMDAISATPNGAYFKFIGGVSGTLNFVTRQGGVETLTLIASTGAGADSVQHYYEVSSNDGGVTWTAYRDGALVATHATNVPTVASALGWAAAATNVDNARLWVHALMVTADRLR